MLTILHFIEPKINISLSVRRALQVDYNLHTDVIWIGSEGQGILTNLPLILSDMLRVMPFFCRGRQYLWSGCKSYYWV